MQITKNILCKKILDFLNRKITNEEFANWAEDIMLEGEYEEQHFEIISDAISRIGIINVKGFELEKSYFLNILKKLNYNNIYENKYYNKEANDLIYA